MKKKKQEDNYRQREGERERKGAGETGGNESLDLYVVHVALFIHLSRDPPGSQKVKPRVLSLIWSREQQTGSQGTLQRLAAYQQVGRG